MHVAAWHSRTLESKFTKLGEEMSIGQTHNNAKFCGNPTRNVRDIPDQKFVLPEKVSQIHQNRLKPATPKAPIMPNFIEIGETTLEKSVSNFLHPSIFWLSRGTPWAKGHRSPTFPL